MERIDRLGWEARFSFVAYGVHVGIRVKWTELVDRAEGAGNLRPFTLSLYSLRALMGVEIPSEVRVRLPQVSLLERRFLHGAASRQLSGPVGGR